MKEITYKIPDESTGLVTELVEKLGGRVEKKSLIKTVKKKSEKKIVPTFLFGKWKNFDVDAKKMRDELWARKY